MRPPFYVRQLQKDLDEWIAKGWVPESSRALILESAGAGQASMNLPATLGVFGVLLIGAGAMSFIAANWQDMSKLTRLIVLFGSMWGAYGLAAHFLSSRPWIGGAFVLLGVLLFGVNIMLIAQIYHINAHFPNGVLLWGGGALAAAALAPSRASLAAAFALGGLWTYQESTDFSVVLHWPFLIYWAVATAIGIWLGWRPAIQLAALTLIGWLVLNTSGIQNLLGWSDREIPSLYFFLPFVFWTAAVSFVAKGQARLLTVEHYAFFVWMIAYFVLHIFAYESASKAAPSAGWIAVAAASVLISIALALRGVQRGALSMIDVLGVAFTVVSAAGFVVAVDVPKEELKLIALVCILIVIIWSLARGTRMQDSYTVNLATVAFGAWILYAYFAVFAGFLDQALFFLVGGLVLLGTAFALDKLRRSLLPPGTPGATAASIARSSTHSNGEVSKP